ncbi:BA14K family protein [Flaviflagellibacter deserti]|jgi:hypothetical protein|uniref:Lectin-like protein BA14k n=1 Tax=Flaviflagellibacter deserti TaxID=2267266 RepID=A0ABV9Z0H0_9HYPH
MKKFLATGIAALMAAGSFVSPAAAQFAGSAPAAVAAAEKTSNVTEIRSRHGGGHRWHGNRHGRWHGNRGGHRYYGYRHRHYGYGYRDYYGPAFAAGIIGLTAGAIAANAGSYDRNDEYCAARFRSYDPRSGTYLGYDGFRHACP